MWTKLCWSFSKCWLLGLLSTSGVNLMEIPSEEIRLLRKIDRFLTALPCCKIKTCSLSNPDTFLTLTRKKIKPWCPQVWTNSFKQGESCNIYERKFPFQPAFFFSWDLVETPVIAFHCKGVRTNMQFAGPPHM